MLALGEFRVLFLGLDLHNDGSVFPKMGFHISSNIEKGALYSVLKRMGQWGWGYSSAA